MRGKITFILLVIAAAFAASLAFAEGPEDGDADAGFGCELKFLLDTDTVLDEEHLLRQNLREAFQTGDEYKTIGAMYLDTEDRDFLNAGWINRIRLKDGKSKYTICYKKRYSVEGNDYEAALAAARADGFSPDDGRFSTEIDWGYSRMTLSFSTEVELKMKEKQNIDLLGYASAIRMIADNMPPEEKDLGDEGRGLQLLGRIQIAGPIHYRRYTGELDGYKVHIEIFPVPNGGGIEYIVELSAKCDDMEEAAEIRESFMDSLEKTGILTHKDGLKTQMILRGLSVIN